MSVSQDRVVGRPVVLADGAPVADASYGNPSGGIIGGTSIDFTINWDQGPVAGYSSHFTGKINDEGFASGTLTFGNRQDNWSSSQKFSCITPSAPPAPAPAPAARLAVVVKGPTTLATGLSGTYTASLSNSGDVSALVELYISFGGQLQQTGQVIPSGGFNCDVINNAGAPQRCTAAPSNFRRRRQRTSWCRGGGRLLPPGWLSSSKARQR